MTYYFKKVYQKTHSKDLIIPRQEGVGGLFKTVQEIRYFNCKKARFYWDPDLNRFLKVDGLEGGASSQLLHSFVQGLSVEEKEKRRFLYGKNEIIVPMESLLVLFFKEILTPFYIFQVFSLTFWFLDNYWKYSLAITITSILSLSSALYQTRTNQKKLRDTIVTSDIVTTVRPDGKTEDMMTSELVPGDVIVVPDHGCQLLCDAVLVEGQAIMDESMLTGESVPITKTSLPRHPPHLLYHSKEHEKHTLRCGTKVIQTRKYRDQVVKAVVIRTGYNTTKGDLVRSILYPPPVDFQFDKDSHKFIGTLALIATAGMFYTMYRMYKAEETFTDMIFEVLDLITIAVPPALPAAMTICIVMANKRLIPKNIFCISPRTINVAGAVDCTCFDKTGTITEDGMDMWGVVPASRGLASLGSPGGQENDWCEALQQVRALPEDSLMLLGMASCHELNIIGGEMRGDPLEEKMFASTGWNMELEGEETSQMDQLSMPYIKSPRTASNSCIQAAPQKLFQFSSDMQRMSVITRAIEEREEEGFTEPVTVVFCKGSPETVGGLCCPSSLPPHYSAVVESYAARGFRILGLASRVIEPARARAGRLNKMTRDQVETGLTFLGLIIMENRLKPASLGVIRELNNARIRTIMVTGDNILTAVSVAKECGILPAGEKIIRCRAEMREGSPVVSWSRLEEGSEGVADTGKQVSLHIQSPAYHLTIDGASFEVISTHCRNTVLPYLATRGAVFARMKPEMKQSLVEILQDLDYRVIMCGDGANDCGALKAANAGISLSEAEASVASPFTSKTPDISCVPALIRESRCALVTAFGIFKYMAAYSITQFVSVIILYEMFSNLSDMQFLWIDLFLITTLAALFGYTRAHEGPLAPQPPMSSLISVVPLFSLICQLSLVIIFQVSALLYTRQFSQTWFVEFDYENPCYTNTTAAAQFSLQKLDEGGCDPDDDPVASYENYAVFSISQFQYIILLVTFAKGKPYRESFYKNIRLVVDILLLTGFSLFLTVWPDLWTACGQEFESFAVPSQSFRWMLVGMAGVNLALSLLCEMFLADVVVRRLARSQHKKHEVLSRELEARPDWPPLSPECQQVEAPVKVEGSGENLESKVVIMETEAAKPKEAVFDSLFQTPGSTTDSASPSHSAAAIILNPPATTPRKTNRCSEVALASPSRSFTTAQASPASSSSMTGRFVSCDTLDCADSPPADR